MLDRENGRQQGELYGLLLSGGQSRRMGKDKSVISYHGVSQVDFYSAFLKKYCRDVFVSCRKDQTYECNTKYSKIYDCKEYDGIGPIGGILSAMMLYPDVAWLVLACDMPFVNEETILRLLQGRRLDKCATVYSNSSSMIEPLCSIYEPRILKEIQSYVKKGRYSPQEILLDSSIEVIEPYDDAELVNINSPAEAMVAMKCLKTKENVI